MTFTITPIATEELRFDWQNPRLREFGISENTTDDEILQKLWDNMDVKELVMSISANGFFQHEALIVAKENGQNVVIEGNRRLAAVKAILNHSLVQTPWDQMPQPSEKILSELKELPCLTMKREDAWRFLGFKHVNGPSKWTGFAKATYIAKIHNDYHVPLNEIAKQIGDRNKTVERLYRGLMLLEQARLSGRYDPDDSMNDRIFLSHLYTGIGYEGFQTFLGIRLDQEHERAPVPDDRLDRLEEICVWLYGSKKRSVQPIIHSQNPDLKNLDSVLKNNEALEVLRNTGSLVDALDATHTSTELLEKHMMSAKSALKNAMAVVSEGFNGAPTLLEAADTLIDLSNDLYDVMLKKKTRMEKEQARQRDEESGPEGK